MRKKCPIFRQTVKYKLTCARSKSRWQISHHSSLIRETFSKSKATVWSPKGLKKPVSWCEWFGLHLHLIRLQSAQPWPCKLSLWTYWHKQNKPQQSIKQPAINGEEISASSPACYIKNWYWHRWVSLFYAALTCVYEGICGFEVLVSTCYHWNAYTVNDSPVRPQSIFSLNPHGLSPLVTKKPSHAHTFIKIQPCTWSQTHIHPPTPHPQGSWVCWSMCCWWATLDP